MCFFGGFFITTIAAFEAYRVGSHENMTKCIHELYEAYNSFQKSNKEDDSNSEKIRNEKDNKIQNKHDDDRNGNENSQELIIRKTSLFFKSVDPKVCFFVL